MTRQICFSPTCSSVNNFDNKTLSGSGTGLCGNRNLQGGPVQPVRGLCTPGGTLQCGEGSLYTRGYTTVW